MEKLKDDNPALDIIEAVLDGRVSERLYNGDDPENDWLYEVSVPSPADKPCPTCEGTGTIEAVDGHGDTLNVCFTCLGSGIAP